MKQKYGRTPSVDENHFRLLYKLNPVQAQNDLLEYWNKDEGTHNLEVAELLSEFNTTNQSAANRLVEIRSIDDDDLLDFLNTAIFYLDPERGKNELKMYMEKEIQGEIELEDYYSNLDKVLSTFALDMYTSSEGLEFLSNYVKSDINSTSSDASRYAVLKILQDKSPETYEDLLIEIEQKELQSGEKDSLLEFIEEESE